MRIGIFTDTYPPYINGVSNSIAMLESALVKKGHEVFIATVNTEDMRYKYENDERVIKLPGIPIGIYDYRLTGIYPLKAIKKIKDWNLDIIHSHTEFGVGTFARIIAKQLDIPIVHTYHTMYEDYIHYITKGYFDAPSRKIVEHITNFYCDKTITELIVPTRKTYNLFKEKYEFARNIHIVPTGIDVERFYRENNKESEVDEIRKELGIEKDDFVLLFVGRLAAEKNVTFLIENQVNLIKENKKCKLIIIGDGPETDLYKRQARKLGIGDSVIFTGKVPWAEINKYYQIPNIFVTASHTETQGLTLLEAMAASVPVVALEDEAFREVVVEDLNGYLFKDKKEYRKYILKIMKDQSVFERLSRQARIQGESHSSKYYAEKVLDVYYTALGGENGEPRKKEKRTFIDKVKNVVKRGFNGK
jgi:Glycosyltransferase